MNFTLPTLTGPAPEWATSIDPRPMVDGLTSRRSAPAAGRADSRAARRKARLFALACCNRVRAMLKDPASLRAVEALEDYASGTGTLENLIAAGRGVRSGAAGAAYAHPLDHDPLTHFNLAVAQWAPGWAMTRRDFAKEAVAVATAGDSWRAIECFRYTTAAGSFAGADAAAELAAHADLLRCVFGNPARDADFDPAWRTETVYGVAAGIHERSEFGNLPVLADALQDAGCEDDAILTHCRADTPHARGCWVLDRILSEG